MVYYQMAFEHEVWGSYRCNIRFLDEGNEVIYSRNVLCNDLTAYKGGNGYFIPLTPPAILLQEVDRASLINDLVVIDFQNNHAYRKHITDNFSLSRFLAINSKKQIVMEAKTNFIEEPLYNEKIKLPLFRFFGKRKMIVW